MRFIAVTVAVLSLGCTEELEVPAGWLHPECADAAWVEVYALDIWGRDLPGATVTPPTTTPLPLTPNSPFSVTVQADGYLAAEVSATWDGGPAGAALTATATAGARTAVSVDVATVNRLPCRVYGLFIGLDHPYYAAGGRAPQAGNQVDFLMDGEELWSRVAADLSDPDRPVERVHQTTWWWESDAELIRPPDHITLTPEARWKNTMMAHLEARGGMHRVLVTRFATKTAPGMAFYNTDPVLRAKGETPDDEFQVILQGNHTQVELPGNYTIPERPFSFVARVRRNPTHAARTFYEPTGTLTAPLVTIEAASFHQKAIVVNNDLAYVSGMNVKRNDWDTSEHILFDARRMLFGHTQAEREAVAAKEAQAYDPPRKDYGVRIVGPAAQDVDDLLKQRWDYALASGAMFAEHATAYELLPRAAPQGDVTVQIVATSPEPMQERAILETHNKASRQAKDLILIEDQYWRAPLVHDALIAAMDGNPGLHMIVVTKPIKDNNAAKKYSLVAHETFLNRYPDRYQLLQLKTFDRGADGTPHFIEVFVHSKLHLIDDHYLSVGSCNKNNRGYLFEGELNVAIVDPQWVAAAKARVLANLVGPTAAADVVGKDGATVFAVFKQLAESNAAVEATLLADPAADLAPEGFLYPLSLNPGFLFDVGPDLF